jgi:4-hydroxybenzoate polyprenyltransferase
MHIFVKVERTRLRPIVSGALTPFQGLTFLGCQLLLGLGILLQLNTFRQALPVILFQFSRLRYHIK